MNTAWAPEILGNYHWSAVAHAPGVHNSSFEIIEPAKCPGCAELKRRREALGKK